MPSVWRTWIRTLGRNDPLEKRMATHSSILAWRTLQREDPGRPQSMGLHQNSCCILFNRSWQKENLAVCPGQKGVASAVVQVWVELGQHRWEVEVSCPGDEVRGTGTATPNLATERYWDGHGVNVHRIYLRVVGLIWGFPFQNAFSKFFKHKYFILMIKKTVFLKQRKKIKVKASEDGVPWANLYFLLTHCSSCSHVPSKCPPPSDNLL